MIRLWVAVGLLLVLGSHAEARHRHAPEPTLWQTVVGAVTKAAHAVAEAAATPAAALATAYQRPFMGHSDGEEVMPHPSGCPNTKFCGCGVAVKVFGSPRRDLWAAASWRQFPRASCAPGHVAVWSGHVAYILQCNGDGTAKLYDPNSGGSLTRIDTRPLPSLIVDPKGS